MAEAKRTRGTNALRGMVSALAVAALAAAILYSVVVVDAIEDNETQDPVIAGLSLVALLGAIWIVWHLIGVWREDVQRLKGALILAEGRHISFSEQARKLVESGDLRMLAETMDHVLIQQQSRQATAEARLAGVLGAIPAAILVITGRGLVSLVNAPARATLPDAAIAPGTSIYAALRRDSLDDALREAVSRGGNAAVMLMTTDDRALQARVSHLGDSGGMVLVIDTAGTVSSSAHLEHALELHDALPVVAPVTPDTPLSDLPLLALDCETTGLDPTQDRVVSFGAVLAHGRRVFVHENIDRLVKPDIAIPSGSTAIHGIDDAMVSGADSIAAGLADLAEMGRGRVVLGHNIGFDLALLRHEAHRTGTFWQTPHALDTGLLVAALEPSLEKLDLDHIAERYGVTISGRHTALGDALVAADLFSGLIPVLESRGVSTLGEAEAFMCRAKGLLARQKQAGWLRPGEPDVR